MTPEIRIEREPYLSLEVNPYPGLFIDIEGLDGCGESTQVALVAQKLRDWKNYIVHETDNPNEEYLGGTDIRLALRKRLVMSPMTLQKIFVGNRSDHLDYFTIPRLKRREIVMNARYIWSTVAFGSLDIDRMRLLEMNQDFPLPDLSFFLKVLPEKCLQRKHAEGVETEFFEEIEIMKKVWPAYEWIAEQFPDIVQIVDGDRAESEVANEIFNIISSHPKLLTAKNHV